MLLSEGAWLTSSWVSLSQQPQEKEAQFWKLMQELIYKMWYCLVESYILWLPLACGYPFGMSKLTLGKMITKSQRP